MFHKMVFQNFHCNSVDVQLCLDIKGCLPYQSKILFLCMQHLRRRRP